MTDTAIRSEKVDARRVLLGGELGYENGTDPAIRRRERERVVEYWPEGLRTRMVKEGVPWRLLVDPTGFRDVDPAEVHAFVSGYRAHRRAWPSIDLVRRRFGRVSNHRAGGEVEGQGSLL
jgi:hypothetical protein